MLPLNELQFKLDINADINEAREYFKIIKTEYADRYWSVDKFDYTLTKEAWYGFEDIDYKLAPGGWGLQSHLKGSEVCPPWIISTYDPIENKNTDIVFGFAEKLLKKIPMAKWLGISVTPPGGGIVSHQDSHWHIHLPIYSPKESYLTWDDENKNPVHWEHFPADGSIYAWRTTEQHSVVNKSNEDRIHLFFKVEMEEIPNLFKLTGTI